MATAAREEFDSLICQFNQVQDRYTKSEILEKLLAMDELEYVTIYGRACYSPSKKKLLQKKGGLYVKVADGSALAIVEPLDDSRIDWFPLDSLKLGPDQVLEGIKEDVFKLNVTIQV